jgi:aspartate/methionine/tyrosine aminotransferase
MDYAWCCIVCDMQMSFAAQKTGASGIRAMFEKAKMYENVINVSVGEPGFITPEHIIKVASDNLLAGKTKYTPNAGIPAFRQAIAKKLRKENGILCDPDRHLIVTAGATQALMLTMMALVNPGDEVIIPNPAWPNYLGQVLMVNAVPVEVPLREENGFRMTADLIEPLITSKTKLIVINSPANPTGATLTYEDVRDIAGLVRRCKVFIISDEPYEHILFDESTHHSLASFPGLEDYVITINCLSKTYAMTGWRLGYVCANEEITKTLIKLHENIVSNVNEAFQLAGAYALESAAEDVQTMCGHYKKNRDLIVTGLNRIKGFSCVPPQGTFYAFPNIKKTGMSSQEAAETILEKTHVVCSPGSAFGSAGEGYLRFSFASGHEAIGQALRRMSKLFDLK